MSEKRGRSPTIAIIDTVGSAASKKRIAAVMFVVSYSYPLLNSYITIQGAIGLCLDFLMFFCIPVACFILLSSMDPFFRQMLIDGMKRCSTKDLVILLICGVCLAYLYMYISPYSSSEESITSYALKKWGLAGVIYLALSAGVIEEALYKPLLNYVIPWRVSNIAFAIVSGAIFGAAHHGQSLINILIIIFYGTSSAYYFRLTNNIFGLIAMHFITDFIIFGQIWAWQYA